MQRLIDIERRTNRLCIRFPYAEELVAKVRTLPGRRWDPSSKAWFVPFDHVEHVLNKLVSEHFKISAELRDYCQEQGQAVEELLGGGDEGGRREVPEGTVTVSELNQQAKMAIQKAFPDDVWMVGELQTYDRNKPGGHAYFEIVERLSEDEDPIARVRAVMFREDRREISDKLASSVDDVRLRDGLAVRVRAKVDLYGPHGSYQVIVRDIDPSYTTGKIHQNRERIVAHLDAAGILEKNLSVDWATCPLRVGLITSYDSDAYNDFIHELEKSAFGFQVTVHHANVQGSQTEPSVLRALRYFEERADAYDVLAIVRGGGSRSDLAYFDTEAIGEAICRHPLKIVVGVGHQRDTCLLDVIAESQKTPTAAAGAMVERVDAFLTAAEQAADAVFEAAQRHCEESMQRLRDNSVRLERSVERRLKVAQRRLDRLRSQATYVARERLSEAARRVDTLAQRIPARATSRIDRAAQAISFARRRLRLDRLQRRLDRAEEQLDLRQRTLERASRAKLRDADRMLDGFAQKIRLLDPQRVLERGYSMLTVDGRVVTKTDDVPFDEAFDVRMSDGSVRAKRVEQQQSDQDEES
ncbi:MAG: exodeoxyribonuclease VII large subunit [Myxococcota bacterium]